MEQAESPRNDVAAAALYAAARTCSDARLRGAILALASMREGLTLMEAAQIWRVDPAALLDVERRFNVGGIDAL